MNGSSRRKEAGNIGGKKGDANSTNQKTDRKCEEIENKFIGNGVDNDFDLLVSHFVTNQNYCLDQRMVKSDMYE